MPQPLVRLTYASTATFQSDIKGGIESEVARVLLQSRRNNPKANLGGVLHFGNGYFFQCLEGPRDQVNRVYQKISQDTRHRNVQVLSTQSVDQRLFSDWSMKYLPLEENLSRLLETHGQKQFDPYGLNDTMIDALLHACVYGVDPIAELGQTSADQSDNALTTWWKKLFQRR